ncbi:sugar ABC transporter ATP-binding protein [Lichenihabitans sp. Uapishka_5]|uniref:sugar ABC transporter ATP-binding protein n=1 Tax=Lichenihabitans sp. Uapishka_5 TaxID=3037302 RepID=UPI0029E81199|nr:sugar ABC transporter ATP-binding protein [Lichenihabitans sp. Uapishka_5]MDX7950291.1 sugar ABC transporter ATP-binding protein [Lichenihabitans sp. Uapishka_5]
MTDLIETPQHGLVCRKLVKAYGGRPVLKSVDLVLKPGSVLGLIGENGAGKSTLNSCIAGVVRLTGGEMLLDGVPYAPTSPSDAMAKGVALIHQEIRLLPGLTVAENMFLGRQPLARGRIDRGRMVREAGAALEALGVAVDPRRTVGGLSMAVQQGIEIAKAILRKPRYIIFDEPTASVGASEAERIFEQIRLLRKGGASIVYVSHRLDEVQAITDRVLCLRDGERVGAWEGPVSQQDMINAMVGRDFTFEHHAPKPRGNAVALKIDGLCRDGAFRDISFDLAKGEILGFAGLIGAGRTEVVRAIAGADRADAGEIRVEDHVVRITSPRSAIAAGIFMVPEDRKGQGLNLDRSAAKNISLPWEAKLQRFGVVTPGIVARTAETQKRRFDIRGQIVQPVGRMSGGNQQKVLIGKWLVETPKVFIVDEPTRGVDVGAKMAIYEILRGLAAEGVAVIVVSSELEEVLGLSHRILVMSGGRQQGILSRDEATPERVMALAVGASPNAGVSDHHNA